MTTISLRVNDDESKLIHDYVSVNQLNMSQFIRDAVLDKIENDLSIPLSEVHAICYRSPHNPLKKSIFFKS